jgi:hypothetical protein
MNETDQLSTSFTVEALEEIIHNCQRNERRLHELERHTRHERKKAERLLRETYQEREKQSSISLNNSSQPKPQQFFVSLDDEDNQVYRQQNNKDKPSSARTDSKTTTKERQSTIDNTQRVRFNLPEKDNQKKKPSNKDDELDDLARRCEQLLSRLNTQCLEASMLAHDDDNKQNHSQSISLQQSLELLRPEFISHSRQRVQHINHLREERECKSETDHERSYSTRHAQTYPQPVSFSYKEMKQSSKKKYQQLPEYHDRLRQGLLSEIRRRNYLRAKIFRIRLRQHVLSHGRTNIDKSLTMIDT